MIATEPRVMKPLDAAPESSETEHVRALADTAEARKLKVKLAAAYRILARYGLDQGIAGHISQRVPGAPDYFWVNPFGLQFSQVCADNLALINHHGQLVAGWPVVNYAAFCIHGAIHHGRPDVHCAVHTHSPAGSASVRSTSRSNRSIRCAARSTRTTPCAASTTAWSST